MVVILDPLLLCDALGTIAAMRICSLLFKEGWFNWACPYFLEQKLYFSSLFPILPKCLESNRLTNFNDKFFYLDKIFLHIMNCDVIVSKISKKISGIPKNFSLSLIKKVSCLDVLYPNSYCFSLNATIYYTSSTT